MKLKSLYYTNEIFLNEYSYEFPGILSVIAIISAICVITSKNPIISILYLIALFSSVATYLILVGMFFIGLSYLLVYIGAISILFLFIIMLINVRISELHTSNSNSIPLAVIIVILFSYPIIRILPHSLADSISLIDNLYQYVNNNTLEDTSLFNFFNTNYYSNTKININSLDTYLGSSNINYVTSNYWDSNLAETSHITTIGTVLYTNYAVWLIITSLILLLSMIGAIVITLNPKQDDK